MDSKELMGMIQEKKPEVTKLSSTTIKKLFKDVDKVNFANDEEMELYVSALKADFDMFFNFGVLKYLSEHKRK